ncbi:MAG: hypothetical protein KME42_08425 [Tildeniella nuda ZEHNDER 1965/U140]|jgi:hypothetical protein|nr:hypothetical protein [Tildeniella nuda ZEHNDER 1965/U140]
MDLSRFLEWNKISLDDVFSQANASLELVTGDVLFAAGSVVEGLGNYRSDLDLILITQRNDIQYTSLNDVTVTVGDCIIDIRVIQFAELEYLLMYFDQWSKQPREPRRAKQFTEAERMLLHRLRTGQPIYGETLFGQLRNQVNPTELARLKLDFARHFASTIQVDLDGFRTVGDHYSMLFAAQELLGHTIDALLAGYRRTNPYPKWRVRLLQDLPKNWDMQIPGRIDGLDPVQTFLKLHCAIQNDVPTKIFDHALQIVAFSRRVFPWAEYSLLDSQREQLSEGLIGSSASVSTFLEEPVLPHLNLDVEVSYQDNQLELRCLNRRENLYMLSPQMYLLLCLFDGKTTETEVVSYLEKLNSKNTFTVSLDEAKALVRYANLQAKPIFNQSQLDSIFSRFS